MSVSSTRSSTHGFLQLTDPTLAAHWMLNAAQQWFQLREPQRIRAASSCCKGTLHRNEMERELKNSVDFTQYWWGKNPKNTNSAFFLIFLNWATLFFFFSEKKNKDLITLFRFMFSLIV